MRKLFSSASSYPARPLAVLALLLAAVGTAQAQTPASFAAARYYSTGINGNPISVAVADMNGDGRPDIVTAIYSNSGTGTVGVLLGQSGGGFAAVTTYSTGSGSYPSAVAVADVNGDGRPDIVTTDYNGSTVGVLLGLVGGSFAAITTYSTSPFSYPSAVVVADVNGDRRPDLVTANSGTGTVGVLLGQTGGGFAAVTTYPVGGGPQSVAVADMNGDGRPDLVTTDYSNSSTAGVLLGLVGGGFAAITTYSTGPGSYPKAVAVADMNGDGRPDIVTTDYKNNGKAAVLLGLVGGGFAAVATYSTGSGSYPSAVAVADVNGDGRPDLVTTSPDNNNRVVGVLLGLAGGGFAPVSNYFTSTSDATQGVAVADVNGDGRPDIVTANNDYGVVGVLLNTGTYTPLATAPAAAAADEVALFPNPARGGFALQLPAAWGAAPAQAELRNALGQVVRRQAASPAGGATLPFVTEGLAPGIYVLRVQAGGHALARRVVLD